MGCRTSRCQSCSWALTGRLSSVLAQEKHCVEFNMTPHILSSSLCFCHSSLQHRFPVAWSKPGGLWRNSGLGQNGSVGANGSTGMLCPSGMGKQRAQLGRQSWNTSCLGDVWEKETLKDAFGQSTRTKSDAGQMRMAGDVLGWNKTLVGSVTQKPLWDRAVGQERDVPEHHEALEASAWPGRPRGAPAAQGEPIQGPAGQNETTVPAARWEGTVGNATGQNQRGKGSGQNGMGAASGQWLGRCFGHASAHPSDCPDKYQLYCGAVWLQGNRRNTVSSWILPLAGNTLLPVSPWTPHLNSFLLYHHCVHQEEQSSSSHYEVAFSGWEQWNHTYFSGSCRTFWW